LLAITFLSGVGHTLVLFFRNFMVMQRQVFRFSLRSLLLWMTIAAVFFSFFAFLARR
jgi:hypothetical protein